MRVSFEPEALETLYDIAYFTNSINTDGAGQFWITNFTLHLYSYAKPHVTYALCNNKVFAEYGLSCISYNGWVAAFKIEDDELIVHYIVRGNILV